MSNTINRRKFIQTSVAAASAAAFSSINSHAEPAVPENSMYEIDADWQVRVKRGTVQAGKQHFRVREPVLLSVSQAAVIHVHGERVDAMPQYDPNAAPWARGYRLEKLVTYETTAADMLAPETLALRLRLTDADALTPKKDYDFEPRWGTVGLTTGSRARGKPIYIDYDCGWSRIDSIIINAKGLISLREGVPHAATPHPPIPDTGETAVANIWVPGRLVKLTEENIYPIIEPDYPEPRRTGQTMAARLLPKTWGKIQSGAAIKMIAWGDSVTDGGQASNPAHQYQNVFVDMLKTRFPASNPRLTTVAWGGRNSDSFLNEPKGSRFNFEEAVLGPKPDLVIMEFVNDSFMTTEVVEQRYSYLRKRFNEIGAEWIILTPHYVRPDWMGAKSIRVETDPRPYVAGVRQFCELHKVALADASLRWGHLVREGIPYTTLLSNSINHPDDRGHQMFAQALMEVFT
jgi:lysophospholipase L1-like esterase